MVLGLVPVRPRNSRIVPVYYAKAAAQSVLVLAGQHTLERSSRVRIRTE